MKNSSKCCKCGSARIIAVPPMQLVESTRVRRGIIGEAFSNLYVCADCGYAEMWFEDEQLAAVVKRAEKKGWIKESR